MFCFVSLLLFYCAAANPQLDYLNTFLWTEMLGNLENGTGEFECGPCVAHFFCACCGGSSDAAVRCNDDGDVVYINWNSRKLSGTISHDIGVLRHLEYFSVSNNMIHGSLPPTLDLLTAMRLFSISGNQLDGTLPTELASWSDLLLLNVDQNYFSGTVPDLRPLQSLQYLHLFGNQFKGQLLLPNQPTKAPWVICQVIEENSYVTELNCFTCPSNLPVSCAQIDPCNDTARSFQCPNSFTSSSTLTQLTFNSTNAITSSASVSVHVSTIAYDNKKDDESATTTANGNNAYFILILSITAILLINIIGVVIAIVFFRRRRRLNRKRREEEEAAAAAAAATESGGSRAAPSRRSTSAATRSRAASLTAQRNKSHRSSYSNNDMSLVRTSRHEAPPNPLTNNNYYVPAPNLNRIYTYAPELSLQRRNSSQSNFNRLNVRGKDAVAGSAQRHYDMAPDFI